MIDADLVVVDLEPAGRHAGFEREASGAPQGQWIGVTPKARKGEEE